MKSKYFYNGEPLIEYCKKHPEFKYNHLTKYISVELKKDPPRTAQELIDEFINKEHKTYTRYLINGMSLNRYCELMNISYDSVSKAISRARKDPKYKDMDDDARWVAGPLWDLSCGQREKTDYTFRMKASYGFTPHWIGELVKDEDFCSAVRSVWEEFYPQQVQSWMDYIDEHLLPYYEAFEKEKVLWNYSSNETLEQRVKKLKSSLVSNIEWFNNHLPIGITNSVNQLDLADKKIIKVEYINMAGIRSYQPWRGLNMKETTYDDNSIITTKVIIKN